LSAYFNKPGKISLDMVKKIKAIDSIMVSGTIISKEVSNRKNMDFLIIFTI